MQTTKCFGVTQDFQLRADLREVRGSQGKLGAVGPVRATLWHPFSGHTAEQTHFAGQLTNDGPVTGRTAAVNGRPDGTFRPKE